MAARSKPSHLRSSVRTGHDLDHVSPVINKPQQNGYLPSLRSKRPRIASISDEDQFKKKIKVEKPFKQPQQLRIPLRNRRPEPASPPRSLDTEPVYNTNGKLPQPKPKTINEAPPIEETPSEEVFQTEWDEQIEAEQKAKTAALTSRENEKRTLRSHDGGSRSKSELAQYFQNYDQMISLDPTAPELITPKTTITFIDDQRDTIPNNAPSASAKHHSSHANGSHATRKSPVTFTSIPLHNAQRLDLSTLAQTPRRSIKDPMSIDVYIKAHRRPERQEKQLRNIEKERAQHEKVQLDRILEELKGPDWLRAMGISGITESEKKLYEPKRFYFIKEVAALIEKFKYWKEEEKRKKLERDQALLDQMNEASEDAEDEDGVDREASDDDDGEEDEEDMEEQDEAESEAGANAEEQSPQSSPTNSSDMLDAQAARQLLQEASSANLPSHPRPPKVSRSRKKAEPLHAPKRQSRANPRKRQTEATPSGPTEDPVIRTKHSTRPIHSFFTKPSPPAALDEPHRAHRKPDTPLLNGRPLPVRGHRRGRSQPNPQPPTVAAFGKAVRRVVEETVPSEMSEKEFKLPNGVLKQGKRRRAMTTGTNGTADGAAEVKIKSNANPRRSRRTAAANNVVDEEEANAPTKSGPVREPAGSKKAPVQRRSTRTKV